MDERGTAWGARFVVIEFSEWGVSFLRRFHGQAWNVSGAKRARRLGKRQIVNPCKAAFIVVDKREPFCPPPHQRRPALQNPCPIRLLNIFTYFGTKVPFCNCRSSAFRDRPSVASSLIQTLFWRGHSTLVASPAGGVLPPSSLAAGAL